MQRRAKDASQAAEQMPLKPFTAIPRGTLPRPAAEELSHGQADAQHHPQETEEQRRVVDLQECHGSPLRVDVLLRGEHLGQRHLVRQLEDRIHRPKREPHERLPAGPPRGLSRTDWPPSPRSARRFLRRTPYCVTFRRAVRGASPISGQALSVKTSGTAPILIRGRSGNHSATRAPQLHIRGETQRIRKSMVLRWIQPLEEQISKLDHTVLTLQTQVPFSRLEIARRTGHCRRSVSLHSDCRHK